MMKVPDLWHRGAAVQPYEPGGGANAAGTTSRQGQQPSDEPQHGSDRQLAKGRSTCIGLLCLGFLTA